VFKEEEAKKIDRPEIRKVSWFDVDWIF
jgi:hypothetical protein